MKLPSRGVSHACFVAFRRDLSRASTHAEFAKQAAQRSNRDFNVPAGAVGDDNNFYEVTLEDPTTCSRSSNVQ